MTTREDMIMATAEKTEQPKKAAEKKAGSKPVWNEATHGTCPNPKLYDVQTRGKVA